jgi:hypothetical protein
MPLVALVGPATADSWQPIVNSVLAAACVGLTYVLAGRIGVVRLWLRVVLAVLFGFSTQIWWVTTRGGVWHTGHLVASTLTLLALIELFGRRRMLLIGLAGGAAFLTRAPVLFALPFYGLWALIGPTRRATFTARFDRLGAVLAVGASAADRIRALPWRDGVLLVAGVVPSVAFSFVYNAVRFGSPFESGYGLASLPSFLEAQREVGLFSLAHLGMNLDYLLWHLPKLIDEFPFFRPDGLGLSIFITSPGLLLALLAPWRDRRTWLLVAAFVFTLIPSLLYYGGGWLQYGYRYALDAIPFAIALCAMALAARPRFGRWLLGAWLVLVLTGVLIGAAGVYWAFHL